MTDKSPPRRPAQPRKRITGTLRPRYHVDQALPVAECIAIMAEG